MFKINLRPKKSKFRLSRKSRRQLKGVHPDMIKVVERAIELTEVDFAVFEGLRSRRRQQRLFENGSSRTLNSRHITGHAVDLVPYIDGRLEWHWPACHKIAIAMRQAAQELRVPMTWGAVWDRDLRTLSDETESEMMTYGRRYIARKKKQGVKNPRPFFDGPHYQLPWDLYPVEA